VAVADSRKVALSITKDEYDQGRRSAYAPHLGMARFALRPRQRVVLRSLGDALFAHDGGPAPEQLDRLVDGFEAHLVPVSRTLRFGLLAMLELVRWLPFLLLAGVRPFESLPRPSRVRILERMERSRVAALLVPLVAYKSFLAFIFFEDPAEMRAFGYPGVGERKRWLTQAP
jgi:hypothetical protein